MKTLITMISVGILTSMVSGQEITVVANNPAPIQRLNETIVIDWKACRKQADWKGAVIPSVAEASSGLIIISQVTEDELLFQSDFSPHQKKVFIIKPGSNSGIDSLSPVQVKYILPRKDLAWENDRIAFRIYGGPLAGDVRNGLDVWVKRVSYKIIDNWYGGDSLQGVRRVSYHVDHGEGADFFNVGRSLGAGASALWLDGKLIQTGVFTDHTILASGPVRLKFRVAYTRDSVNGRPFMEERTYSLDAGQNLNKVQVRYTGLPVNGPVTIAMGLVKRKNVARYSDDKSTWLSLWGPTNDDSTTGFLGTGVVIDPASFSSMKEDSLHVFLLGTMSGDQQLTYYAGAGWSREGRFGNAEQWNTHLMNLALRIQNPLQLDLSFKR